MKVSEKKIIFWPFLFLEQNMISKVPRPSFPRFWVCIIYDFIVINILHFELFVGAGDGRETRMEETVSVILRISSAAPITVRRNRNRGIARRPLVGVCREICDSLFKVVFSSVGRPTLLGPGVGVIAPDTSSSGTASSRLTLIPSVGFFLLFISDAVLPCPPIPEQDLIHHRVSLVKMMKLLR